MGKVPMRPSREDRPGICAACAAQMFSRLDGRKHEKERHEKLCQPLGLYSGLRRLGGRHGQRLGLSEQARQQWRRGISADLPGWLPLAGSLCIAIGYAVIVTYILKALVDSLVGTLMTADAAAWFGDFSSQPYSVIPYHIIVVGGTLLTLFLGAHSIEKTNKVMMPLFFIIFVVLAVRVALLPGSAEGYKFMFTPRWEALKDPMIWVWAMGQAFFSLSVTGSGMIVYGAYLSKEEDVVDVAQHTALFDTIAAVVAALVIIPACFSYGQDVGAGPGLLFVTLPTILQDIPLGRLFAVILYVAMIFAGVSSLQNMFEAVAESLQHKFPKLSRAAVLGILCVLCLGFGLLMEPISKWGPWMDFVSIYIIPIGATLGAVSRFYVMKKDELLDAVNTGSGRTRGALWYSVGRYVYVPIAVVLCFVALFKHISF